MTQEEARSNKGTEQPLRPSQWRMDFRKSLLGTRTRSVGQTSTPLFQQGSKNGPAEDSRMHSKPLQEPFPLPTPPSVSGAELGTCASS